MKKPLSLITVFILLAIVAWNFLSIPATIRWSDEELNLIASLSLDSLPPLTPNPSNHVSDNAAAAKLGHRLYFDTRLSSNKQVSCASCHQPELMFTDGLPLAVGVESGPMHTPSLVGLAYSPWYYWDGRKDSLWAQALAPLEAKHEHATDRVQLVRLVTNDAVYRTMYEEVFGPLPDGLKLPPSATPNGDMEQQANWNRLSDQTQTTVSRIFSNLGKAIEAYERKLIPGPAKFDRYAAQLMQDPDSEQDPIMNSAEIAGLKLFLGKAQCVTCHNGPLLTNHEFHNTGVLAPNGQLPAMGRYDGIRLAREDPFNCLGKFSDAKPKDCVELRFARDSNDLVGAQKTPTLRNVSLTAPYMHGGQLSTLEQVVENYDKAPTSMLNHNEAKALGLRAIEKSQLRDFLLTLTAPLAVAEKWLRAPG